MKRVIYHTEYYDNNGQFLREEEQDAYFNTLPQDSSQLEIEPPIGCRLLQPKLVPSKLSKEQWEYLKAKKTDSELKYASLCEEGNGGYSIYAIYEQWLGGLLSDSRKTQSASVLLRAFFCKDKVCNLIRYIQMHHCIHVKLNRNIQQNQKEAAP